MENNRSKQNLSSEKSILEALRSKIGMGNTVKKSSDKASIDGKDENRDMSNLTSELLGKHGPLLDNLLTKMGMSKDVFPKLFSDVTNFQDMTNDELQKIDLQDSDVGVIMYSMALNGVVPSQKAAVGNVSPPTIIKAAMNPDYDQTSVTLVTFVSNGVVGKANVKTAALYELVIKAVMLRFNKSELANLFHNNPGSAKNSSMSYAQVASAMTQLLQVLSSPVKFEYTRSDYDGALGEQSSHFKLLI